MSLLESVDSPATLLSVRGILMTDGRYRWRRWKMKRWRTWRHIVGSRRYIMRPAKNYKCYVSYYFCVQIHTVTYLVENTTKNMYQNSFSVLFIHKTYKSEWDLCYRCIRIWLISYISVSAVFGRWYIAALNNVSDNSKFKILCNF